MKSNFSVFFLTRVLTVHVYCIFCSDCLNMGQLVWKHFIIGVQSISNDIRNSLEIVEPLLIIPWFRYKVAQLHLYLCHIIEYGIDEILLSVPVICFKSPLVEINLSVVKCQ